MTNSDTTRSNMQPSGSPEPSIDPAFLEQRLREMRDGLTEAIDREVETLRREGLPIYVSDNGKVRDLQQAERALPKR